MPCRLRALFIFVSLANAIIPACKSGCFRFEGIEKENNLKVARTYSVSQNQDEKSGVVRSGCSRKKSIFLFGASPSAFGFWQVALWASFPDRSAGSLAELALTGVDHQGTFDEK